MFRSAMTPAVDSMARPHGDGRGHPSMPIASPPPGVVLVKGNYGRTGGPETLLASLLGRIDPRRFRAVLVLLSKQNGPHSWALSKGPNTWSQRDVRWRGLAAAPLAARSLGHVCQEHGAALIHSHDARSALTAYLLTRVRPIPWIAHVHGWLGSTHSARGRAYERVEKCLIRGADLVLAGSLATMREALAVGVRRVRLVANSIEVTDPSDWAPDVARVREENGASRDTVLLATVGRLHRGKGQAVLLRSMATLTRLGLDVRAVIVGEGPDLEALQRLSLDLGLQNRVILRGFCPDVRPYLAAADIFVAPSLKESLPLTVLEAMALGRAVVASRVGDIPDVIRDGVNGILVSPGDDADLSDALRSLIFDAARRQRIGDAARDVITGRFAIESMTRALEAAYSDVLAGLVPTASDA
jgi:glycosyltransferase involved in cell wall biosynthesis